MDLQLKDKVVVVTGGANGIGAAIVREAAEEGAHPVIVDRDGEAGSSLAAELRARGLGCSHVALDLLKAENCAAAVNFSLGQFSCIDALVNCAGANDRVGLENGSPEKYLGSLHLNLLHYFNMAHYALPA